MEFTKVDKYRIIYSPEQMTGLEQKLHLAVEEIIENHVRYNITEESLDNLEHVAYKSFLLRDVLVAQVEASIEMALIMGIKHREAFRRTCRDLNNIQLEFFQLQYPQVRR